MSRRISPDLSGKTGESGLFLGFNRERTNKRNVLNDADFNEVRMPEFGQEQQLSFEKSDGETKSKVGRLISSGYEKPPKGVSLTGGVR